MHAARIARVPPVVRLSVLALLVAGFTRAPPAHRNDFLAFSTWRGVQSW